MLLEERAFLDAFGAEFTVVGDEPWIRGTTIEAGSGESIIFSYDAISGLIMLDWSQEKRLLGHVFREGVYHVIVDDRKGEPVIRIKSATENLGGSLVVGIYPHFYYNDVLLLQ